MLMTLGTNEKAFKERLDFEGVRVLTPSWLDEIVQVIIEKVGKQNLRFENTHNSSVRASIESVREQE